MPVITDKIRKNDCLSQSRRLPLLQVVSNNKSFSVGVQSPTEINAPRGYDVTVGKMGDKEVDFVCSRQSEKLYVQVTYLLATEETIQREFGVYDNIRDNFPKYVVSLDELDLSRNGIKHYNIRDFLLLNSWN